MAWFLNQQIGNVVKSNVKIDPFGDVNWVDLEGEWIDLDGKWYISAPYISFTDIEGGWQDLVGSFKK